MGYLTLLSFCLTLIHSVAYLETVQCSDKQQNDPGSDFTDDFHSLRKQEQRELVLRLEKIMIEMGIEPGLARQIDKYLASAPANDTMRRFGKKLLGSMGVTKIRSEDENKLITLDEAFKKGNNFLVHLVHMYLGTYGMDTSTEAGQVCSNQSCLPEAAGPCNCCPVCRGCTVQNCSKQGKDATRTHLGDSPAQDEIFMSDLYNNKEFGESFSERKKEVKFVLSQLPPRERAMFKDILIKVGYQTVIATFLKLHDDYNSIKGQLDEKRASMAQSILVRFMRLCRNRDVPEFGKIINEGSYLVNIFLHLSVRATDKSLGCKLCPIDCINSCSVECASSVCKPCKCTNSCEKIGPGRLVEWFG